ncbi:tRNA preQ1(34) S-adenosylmethionine ribosyltransferase-isomerase QueA [Chloroflexota bacterium]
MKTEEFNYDLPAEFIAQRPIEPRDRSKLMVIDKKKNTVNHRRFNELDDILAPGDLLVMNQTRVIPARIFGRKVTGGKVEILLLRKKEEATWFGLVGGKGLRKGVTIRFDNGPECEIVDELDGSQRVIRFSQDVEPFLDVIGNTPLPPYIHEDLIDPDRYQTIFANIPGSAAAPTAGLHFTQELVTRLFSNNIGISFVTLHVGLDTFTPVTEEDPSNHIIHSEWCEVPIETCRKINQTQMSNGKIIAVGTTSVRTLESAAIKADFPEKGSGLTPFKGDTNLFILPGFRFRIVDAMITNFHLPRSSLIMMVSAFAGKETILQAYEIAKKQKYRFYSFGDAMLIQ